MSDLCVEDECDGDVLARGRCQKHYARLRRRERDPAVGTRKSPRQARIDEFLESGQAECSVHGKHADWWYGEVKHPKGTYRGLKCRPCANVSHRDWVQRNPDHQKPYYRSVRGKAAGLVGGARRRATAAGYPCTITSAWVTEQFERQDGRCAYTGWKFDNTAAGKGRRANPRGMSLDRIDSTQGYTPENTRLVCWGVNQAKTDWLLDDFVAMCKAVAATL